MGCQRRIFTDLELRIVEPKRYVMASLLFSMRPSRCMLSACFKKASLLVEYCTAMIAALRLKTTIKQENHRWKSENTNPDFKTGKGDHYWHNAKHLLVGTIDFWKPICSCTGLDSSVSEGIRNSRRHDNVQLLIISNKIKLGLFGIKVELKCSRI
jgi:hypothetical protein